MAKINLAHLLGEINSTKTKESLLAKAGELIAVHGNIEGGGLIDGKLGADDSAKVQALIDGIIEKFKAEKKFNWRVHILDTIYAIIDITKIIEPTTSNREALEMLVVDLVKDLFKKYNPKIPYVPNFIGNWIKALIVDTISPALIDWLFDKVYDDDESDQ